MKILSIFILVVCSFAQQQKPPNPAPDVPKPQEVDKDTKIELLQAYVKLLEIQKNSAQMELQLIEVRKSNDEREQQAQTALDAVVDKTYAKYGKTKKDWYLPIDTLAFTSKQK